MVRLFTILSGFILIVLSGCRNESPAYILPDKPDYSESEMWHSVKSQNAMADVFYITPTCIWDWTDEDGNVCHFMDTSDSLQRSMFTQPLLLASSLLGKNCNFYAPYYRQITMDSWMVGETESEKRFDIAFRDIADAYRYFIDNISKGRPFVIAGHSQGAKSVIEILKNVMQPDEYKRMVAAYVFGYPLTSEDIKASPFIRPAEDSSDTGCVISFNSVSSPEAASDMFSRNIVCINPLNWKTDCTYAPSSLNRGSVFFLENSTTDTLYTVGAYVDTTLHSVVIDGLNDDDYFIPSIKDLFPKGNYHVYELNLYYKNIQDNLLYRIEQNL